MNIWEYNQELEAILIDSFQPYSGLIKENQDAVKECYAVISRPVIHSVNNEIVNEFLANGGNPKDLCEQYGKSNLPAEFEGKPF